MSSPSMPTSLGYEASTPRRRSWRLGLIVVLAILLGIAGRLCWQKFARPVRAHFQTLSLQTALERTVAQTSFTIDAVADRSGTPSAHDNDILSFLAAQGEICSAQNRPLWAGRLSSTLGRRRFVVLLARPRPMLIDGSSVVLTTYIFSEASTLSPARLLVPVSQLDTSLPLPLTLGPAHVSEAIPSQLLVDVQANGKATQAILTLRADDTLVFDGTR